MSENLGGTPRHIERGKVLTSLGWVYLSVYFHVHKPDSLNTISMRWQNGRALAPRQITKCVDWIAKMNYGVQK